MDEETLFERWWLQQSKESFHKAYRGEKPYTDNWGSGFKSSMKEAWMARAALSDSAGGSNG